MFDLLFIAIVIGFFAGSIGLACLFDRLGRIVKASYVQSGERPASP